ncbi:retrovirus-related Pol polyprotein from transposon 17.6 [Parasteatoda tepidariorum]|uniref:retrovirus-related Pol polyprotein from transposon 17.6 n=1 Tax=Parasteatoda tepidariorum TaxID=114398 RepID=UPI0039BC8310
MYKNSKKEGQVKVLEEIGGIADSSDNIVKLKEKIESTEIFKNDSEFVKNLITKAVEERVQTADKELKQSKFQVELEKLKLERIEKEMLLLEAKNKAFEIDPSKTINNTPETNIENLIHSIKTLSLPVPSKPENFNQFFSSLERAFSTKNVNEELEAEILINMLGEKANSILLYVEDEDLKNYEKLKALILRDFQLTPQECLNNFKNASKFKEETFIQFATRLNSHFEYYCKLRKVETFKSLCNLIISDKIIETLNKEMASHILIRQGENWFNPVELGRELDIYTTSKNMPYREVSNTHKYGQNTFFRSEKNYFRKNQPDRFSQPINKQNRAEKKCYICGEVSHFARDCEMRSKKTYESRSDKSERKNTPPSDNLSNQSFSVNSCKPSGENNFKHELKYAQIYLNKNIPVKAIIDSGAQISVINSNKIKIKDFPKSNIMLTSCFGDERKAKLIQIHMSLYPNESGLKVSAAVSDDLKVDAIINSTIYEQLIKLGQLSSSVNTQTKTSKSEDFYECSCFNINDSCSCECFLFNINNVYRNDELDLSHVNDPCIRNELSALINNYKPNKIKDTKLTMKIILKDEIPVCQRARRLSFSEKQKVNDQISEWLKTDIIRESCSDYCSPIVLCKKKDNSLRLCIDYRKLNSKTIKDRYPLPLIEDVLDQLQGSKICSKIDLRNGFFHIDVDEDSKKYTSFVTPDGQYEFNKVPFGLCNSPSTFQRYINYVFRDLLREGVVVIFMDDIFIPAESEIDALNRLTRVLQTASEYGLELNLKKCQFLMSKINFLGYIIENGTIKPSSEKTLAVQNFPVPKSTKQVQSFLGLTGYFRKFILNYALIAKPLSDLLRDNSVFYFGPEQQTAFQTLKQKLSENPVLHIFKQGAKLELHTDASKFGYGAILFQQSDDNKLHPIHYMSKKTTPQEENYSSYELEVLAIIEALKKFRNYLVGNKFKLVTDCSAFQKIMSKKQLTPKIARWALFLEDFDYEIVHRPSKQMRHVDCLSRYPIMHITCDELTSKIVTCQINDEYINSIKQLLENKSIDDFVVKNNVLYKLENDNYLLVVPQQMQTDIIKSTHANGHFGITKTLDVLKQNYYFPDMKKCVENVVNNCVECILVNRKAGKREGFLNPIP